MKEFGESTENRDRQSEVLLRLARMAKGIEGLDGKTANDIFNSEDEDSRREIISKLSAEQYSQLITGINGVLRNKEKTDWNMDGGGVRVQGVEGIVGGHIFPHPRDKAEIISKSWEGAQQMNNDGRDLEEIGILLGSLLVETHPFGDGNGRTSRLIYLMTKGGYSQEEIVKVLSEDGREEFDMALRKGSIDAIFEKKQGRSNETINTHEISGILAHEDSEFKELVFPEGVDAETKQSIIEGGISDTNILISGILDFIQRHPEINVNEAVKIYGPSKYNKNNPNERKVIIFQKLLSVMTVEQVKELEDIYWKCKKKYTEEMIDIFVNPDKPEYKMQVEGKEIRLIDYFKQRIAEKEVLF
jgi:hypothetical protein